jgi:hypothetical protein
MRIGNNPSSVEDWSECEHQMAIFSWAQGEIEKGRKSLELLGAIPNGIRMMRWNALKSYGALGFRKGMPDIYYFKPNAGFHGLFIELKSQRQSAKVFGTQREMLNLLEENGYKTAICHGYEEAICAINNYDGKSK